jgi:hypothetical protein
MEIRLKERKVRSKEKIMNTRNETQSNKQTKRGIRKEVVTVEY